MAGCRWKKNSYERDREKKMHGPLLILAFCRGGERDKKKLPKAAPGRSVVGSKSDRVTTKKSFALRVVLSG